MIASVSLASDLWLNFPIIFIVPGSKSSNRTPPRLPLPPCLLSGCPGRKKPRGHHSPVWVPLGLGAQAPSPAMPGQPFTALNIPVFPTRSFPESISTAPPVADTQIRTLTSPQSPKTLAPFASGPAPGQVFWAVTCREQGRQMGDPRHKSLRLPTSEPVSTPHPLPVPPVLLAALPACAERPSGWAGAL